MKTDTGLNVGVDSISVWRSWFRPGRAPDVRTQQYCVVSGVCWRLWWSGFSAFVWVFKPKCPNVRVFLKQLQILWVQQASTKPWMRSVQVSLNLHPLISHRRTKQLSVSDELQFTVTAKKQGPEARRTTTGNQRTGRVSTLSPKHFIKHRRARLKLRQWQVLGSVSRTRPAVNWNMSSPPCQRCRGGPPSGPGIGSSTVLWRSPARRTSWSSPPSLAAGLPAEPSPEHPETQKKQGSERNHRNQQSLNLNSLKHTMNTKRISSVWWKHQRRFWVFNGLCTAADQKLLVSEELRRIQTQLSRAEFVFSDGTKTRPQSQNPWSEPVTSAMKTNSCQSVSVVSHEFTQRHVFVLILFS